jgi:hypothetical protein
MSIVRITTREDGSPAIYVRDGDASESADPLERRLGELHEKLIEDARSGELDELGFFGMLAAHQTELARRQHGG